MTALTVEGVYRNGTVVLDEAPEGQENTRVVVMFPALEQPAEADSGGGAERTRREAISQLMADMKRGIDFGGEKFNRAEIYEERIRELDRRRGQGDH